MRLNRTVRSREAILATLLETGQRLAEQRRVTVVFAGARTLRIADGPDAVPSLLSFAESLSARTHS